VVLCTFVTSIVANTTIQKEKQYFQDKVFQFSKRSRHTQKINNKNLHVQFITQLKLSYCALLFMKDCFVKHGSWCSCQSHHHPNKN